MGGARWLSGWGAGLAFEGSWVRILVVASEFGNSVYPFGLSVALFSPIVILMVNFVFWRPEKGLVRFLLVMYQRIALDMHPLF